MASLFARFTEGR